MSGTQYTDTKPDVKPTGETITWPWPEENEEELEISPRMGAGHVWAMKIPKFLLERWERVQEAGVELGTLVVDNSSQPPRITLRLPAESRPSNTSTPVDEPMNDVNAAGPSKRTYDSSNIPDEYEVNVPDERARNSYVFTEKMRAWGPVARGGETIGKRKREKAHPRLLAKIDHECSVKPVRNEKYLKILQQRQLESSQTKRQIIQLEDTGMSRGQMAQLASGFANANSDFGRGMVARPNRIPADERSVRLEQHELTDRLFGLFSDKPYWGIPALKATLKQPDAWLREVLKEIAEPIKEGQYMNMWRLKEGWKVDSKEEREEKGGKIGQVDVAKEEDAEFEDDEDDEDDADLEEVLMS